MKNLKIKYKIALTFIILIVIFSTVTSIIDFRKEYDLGVENYKINGTSLIKNIEPSVANHLFIEDIVGLKRLINDIKESNQDIMYIFVLNAENKIVTHTFDQGFPNDLLKINVTPIQNIEFLDFGKETAYDFSYPIKKGKLGVLRMGISRERLINYLRNSILQSIISLIVFISLSIAILFYISHLITNPLKKLVLSANEISNGNFKHQHKSNSKDEVGQLSVAFNTMCNNLQHLTHKLKEKIELLNTKNSEYEALNEEYATQNEELTIAKEKAEESDNLKTAFLANLSHEIRTPMNGILGFTNLLKNKNLTIEKHDKFLTLIEQSGQRLLKLIEDLIDISKIEAGQIEIREDKVNLNYLIDKMYDFYSPLVKPKGVNLKFQKELPDNQSHIITDFVKLEQIFANLINNAVKFTDSGVIEFGYKIANGKILLWVSDTGKGIPSEMKDEIFLRFRQVEATHNSEQEGSGLGLAICKAFIERMGGNIWLDSEVSKGSTFYFTLPFTKTETTQVFDKQVFKFEKRNQNITILVAEDNDASFYLLEELLAEYHVKILHALDGDEAIQLIKETPDINLVLMDLKMPVMNGFDATREIRKYNDTIPIIAQTAFITNAEREKAMAAGCNDFITKPIDKNELIEKMNLVLK